ncbi:Cobalt transport protein CbiN [uncultured archaeon]|nr:Cobalt transport protein CbiN [uncultured archaeon]
MKKMGYLIIFISIAALLLLVYIAGNQATNGAGTLAGGDDDNLLVNQIGGISDGQYKPWFTPVWEPPSGEVETFLFSFQAAIGAIFVGYYAGYYKGKKEVSGK